MQNSEITLKVDVNELNTIFAALQEMPHRVVKQLLQKLDEQVKAQLEQAK